MERVVNDAHLLSWLHRNKFSPLNLTHHATARDPTIYASDKILHLFICYTAVNLESNRTGPVAAVPRPRIYGYCDSEENQASSMGISGVGLGLE